MAQVQENAGAIDFGALPADVMVQIEALIKREPEGEPRALALKPHRFPRQFPKHHTTATPHRSCRDHPAGLTVSLSQLKKIVYPGL